MKNSALAGVVLTLIMFLLVLVAAFVFLFQGRRTLVARNDALRLDLAETQQEFNQSLQNSSAALATADASSLLLESQLVAGQQQIDAMETAVADSQSLISSLEQEQANLLGQPPQVRILSPRSDAELFVGQAVPIEVVASDVVGVTAVSVNVDETAVELPSIDTRPLVQVSGSWVPTATGDVVMQVMVDNGRLASTITQTLTIANSPNDIALREDGLLSDEQVQVASAVAELRGVPVQPFAVTAVSPENVRRGLPELPLFPTVSISNTLPLWDSFDYLVTTANSLPLLNAYNPQTGEIVVSGEDAPLGALGRYEFVAATAQLLLDQTFGWPDAATLTHDAWLAQYALVVGDAALIQGQVLQTAVFSDEERDQIFDTLAQQAEAELNAPLLVQWQRLLASSGRDFAETLQASSSIASLDAVWATPPASTEQVLHPGKYISAEPPILVSLPDLGEQLGETWRLVAEETLGEAALRFYLRQQLSNDQADRAASGWGGDRFAVYENEDGAVAMVLRLVWDTEADKVEFAALYANYPMQLFGVDGMSTLAGSECWQGDDVICLVERAGETLVVRAPDMETAVGLADFIEQ